MLEKDFIDLEREYAELIGWTNLVLTDNSWLGKPPEGTHSVRDQAMVPHFIRSWNDCGPLIGKYLISVSVNPYLGPQIKPHVIASITTGGLRPIKHTVQNDLHLFYDESIAVRYTIVQVAVSHLKSQNSTKTGEYAILP